MIDHFGLFVGVQTLASRLATYEILKLILDVPGNIIEFGVWKGSNLLFMAKVISLLRPNSNKKVIGFDNFEGLEKFSDQDGKKARDFVGMYKGDMQLLLEVIDLFDMQNWVHLISGDAVDTIPYYEQKNPNELISLAYLDFDLYEPCKVALRYLSKHLSKGGIIAFDEGLSSTWPGEGKAMIDFVNNESNGTFDFFSPEFARQPQIYLIKT